MGNEGVVGISLFMGGDTVPSSAVVQTAGHAWRLERQRLKQEFDLGGATQRLLLLALDRVPARELVMTQELVASILGVRRESITEAAGKLQQRGLIRYRRGHIAVLDCAGLEGRACECYAVVRKESQRLLADVRQRPIEAVQM